jgi:catechol 2,3-dioxygenase-like lactoylglutathione lyase family enzyme
MRRLLFVVGLIGVLALSSRVIEMQTPNQAHFHHVHLNSTDPQKTFEFYEQVFGAKRVKFRDRSDALFTGRGFLLVNKVDRARRPPFATSDGQAWMVRTNSPGGKPKGSNSTRR